MGFLKKLFGGGESSSSSNFYTFKVRCDRCGEIIEGKVNLDNELTLEYEQEGYYARKVLMGSGHCFQQIEVNMQFGPAKRLQTKEASGGTFVDET